jgi:ADP-ribose pyrophosphatase YjhB (NUDIX family)
MMTKIVSCGIAPIRKNGDKFEILLCLPSECVFHSHIGNTFQGMGFLKGQVEENETNLEAAIREFGEESGNLDIELFDDGHFFMQNNPKKKIFIWPAKVLPTVSNHNKITENGTVLDHDEENTLIKFYPIDDLPAVFRNQQKILEELLEFIDANKDKII